MSWLIAGFQKKPPPGAGPCAASLSVRQSQNMTTKRRRKKKSDKPVVLKSWLIPRLRRISRFWPEANEAMKLAWVSPGQYRCASCQDVYHSSEVQRDHIEPIIKVSGFTDWHDVITKLFCPREGYQILCKTCHSAKTLVENKKRLISSK